MVSERDMKILRKVGINSIDELATAVADFIRRHPYYSELQAPLPKAEEAFLTRGGAVPASPSAILGFAAAAVLGERRASTKDGSQLPVDMVYEYAALLITSYSLAEVCHMLNITADDINRLIHEQKLYAAEGPQGLVVPTWQFMNSNTLPGLEKVLSALDKCVHPVAVQRFFLTPHPDLISPATQGPISPKKWLQDRYPLVAIEILVEEL